MNILGDPIKALFKLLGNSRNITWKERAKVALANTSFDKAYETNLWGDSESVSGPGSSLAYTRKTSQVLMSLLELLECKSILDAPCGDLNWMKDLPLGDISYIGGDVSSPLLMQIKSRFPDKDIRFLDITSSPLPKADFWLCRDILFHFSLQDIFLTLKNFSNAKIKYFCTSHFFDVGINLDFPTSAETYRPIDLRKFPFFLPEPQFQFKDYVEGYPRRALAVWDHEQVKSWFELNRKMFFDA